MLIIIELYRYHCEINIPFILIKFYISVIIKLYKSVLG